MKTQLELLNICVLNAGYAVARERLRGNGFSSPFARLYYIKEGEGSLHLPDADIAMHAGHMYIVPAFMTHSMECSEGMAFYYLFVYERYGTQTDLFDIYSFPYEVEANQEVDMLFEFYCNHYPELYLPNPSSEAFFAHPSFHEYALRYTQLPRHVKMQLQGFVWIVGSFFMKHAHKKISSMDERLLRVVEYVKDNISQEVTLDAMADIACVTKSHLGRLFRDNFGCSALQYVLLSKVKCAQRLLITSDFSVAKIAGMVGFRDASYFIRTFKQKIGFTPNDYRNGLR